MAKAPSTARWQDHDVTIIAVSSWPSQSSLSFCILLERFPRQWRHLSETNIETCSWLCSSDRWMEDTRHTQQLFPPQRPWNIWWVVVPWSILVAQPIGPMTWGSERMSTAGNQTLSKMRKEDLIKLHLQSHRCLVDSDIALRSSARWTINSNRLLVNAVFENHAGPYENISYKYIYNIYK